MAFKLKDASSSLWPPKSKVAMERADTIVRKRVLTVPFDLSWVLFVGAGSARCEHVGF